MPDFFVSYNHADKVWAEWIGWELGQAGYSIVVQSWDFRAGSNFVMQMHRSITHCDRIVLVLSPDYLAADFTQAEWAAVFSLDPTGKFRKLVPVRGRDCEPVGLLKSIVFIDLVGKDELVARRLLLDEIREAHRPTVAPPFPTQARRFPASLPTLWNVPYLRNPSFTGREELLNELRSCCVSGRAATQAICGLGGIGKTSVVVEYAYRNAPRYAVVWWMRAEEPALLMADYALLASRLGVIPKHDVGSTATVGAVRDWLSQNDGWLLVFDNAQDVGSCQSLLPYGTSGHVIVTSRNPSWKKVAGYLCLPTLTREESVAFLLKRTGQSDDGMMAALGERLGGLPLALEHAAAYIDATGNTVSQYVALLRKHSPRLLGTVAATWSLLLERLQTEKPRAVEVLNLFAFLAPDKIPRGLARRIAGSELDLNEAVAALREHSLVEADASGIRVHRLVQAAARERLKSASEEAEWAGRTVLALFRLRSFAGTARLLPHLLVATGHSQRLGVELETTAKLLVDAGSFLRDRDRIGPSAEVLERALKVAEKAFGQDHVNVGSIADMLAQVVYRRGELPTALELTRRALHIELDQCGANTVSASTRHWHLGVILNAHGEFAEATQHLKEALRIDTEIYGPAHPKLAALADDISDALQEHGDLDGALHYAQLALAIDEKTYGTHHIQVAIDENNLGVIYTAMDADAEAKEHFDKAMSLLGQISGAESILRQVSENLLALEGGSAAVSLPRPSQDTA